MDYGQVNDLVVTTSKIYVATEDSSLMVFNYDESASSFNKTFSDHTISKLTCLLKDREGNIWAAGENELLRTGKTGLEVVYHLTRNRHNRCIAFITPGILPYGSILQVALQGCIN
jgi:ligand-binding sensor domain-containing protein